MTAAPPQAPESQDSPPSTARLLSVLAIVSVVCVGLVVAGVLLVSGSDGPDQGRDDAPAAQQVPPHDLPAAEAPTIRLAATPDSAGGWNLQLVTGRFTWAPQRAGAPHIDGEGHGHVWVGDTKVGRAYGEWFYLPERLVPVGEQTVRVVLNGNDHGDYRADGIQVAATVTVVATEQTAADGHHHRH